MNNLSHDAAIDAICKCAASISVLSYQEAIEGYFKLRGLPIPDAPSLAAQDGLVEAAGELAFAEAEYRRKHDLCGRGHIDTGRAWDRMRRAGDKVRAALASIEVKSS